MDANSVKLAFEGVDEAYKHILARETKSKELFKQCVADLNNSLGGPKALDACAAGQQLISPAPVDILCAFKYCKYTNLKVVLIGQDPYPNVLDAMGLCFSVRRDRPLPKSLEKIYDALVKSGFISQARSHGDLSAWAKQGVLMLNVALTTSAGDRGSHLDIWKKYTKKILGDLAEKCAKDKKPLVFMLWGGFAHEFESIVNQCNHASLKANLPTLHRILKWGHPSPTSPYNKGDPGIIKEHFANCDNFKRCNEILEDNGLDPIDWDPDCEITE
jgi:uracil-DNA glycosylase